MSESKAKISLDRQTASANGRRFSDDFKRDAVRLVVDAQYTFKAATKAVGVSEKILGYLVSEAWRGRYLACGAMHFAGPDQRNNAVIVRARAALGR